MAGLTKPNIDQINIDPITLPQGHYNQGQFPQPMHGFAGPDIPAQTAGTTTNVSGDAEVVVPFPSAFIPGMYVIATGNVMVSGLYRVTSVGNASITLHGYEGDLVGSQLKPINATITTTGEGLNLSFRSASLSNIVIIATSTPYGVIQGSKYEQGNNKPTCNIGSASYVGVDGGTRAAWVVGGSGSALGVDNIAIMNCNIGLLSVHGASVVGTGAYIKDSGEDSFKCEHSSMMYLTTGNALRTSSQSHVGCRYASSQEMAGFHFLSPTTAFTTSQFNSYVSLRDCTMSGSTTYGLNAVDGGVIALNNIDLSGSSGTTPIRASNGAIIRSVGANSNLVGSYTGANVIEASNVQVNGTTLSGRKVRSTITPGSINAGARFSQQRSLPGYRIGEDAASLNLTVLGELPIGVIPFVIGLGEDLIRVTLQNVGSTTASIPTLDILVSY